MTKKLATKTLPTGKSAVRAKGVKKVQAVQKVNNDQTTATQNTEAAQERQSLPWFKKRGPELRQKGNERELALFK
jgi:hypothetical protein